MRSVYRLDNPLSPSLRPHHGRPGKRTRILDADSHGTLCSSLRQVIDDAARARAGGDEGPVHLTKGEGCTWLEEEEFQLRHLRPEGSSTPVHEPAASGQATFEMAGTDRCAVVCLQEGYCRSWLSPSTFGGTMLSIEFALRFGDWRARSEIQYKDGSLVNAVSTWEKAGEMPSHLVDTTYKDITSSGPEGQDVVIYNDWHGVSFGRVDASREGGQVFRHEARFATWPGFSVWPDVFTPGDGSAADAGDGQAEKSGYVVRGEELYFLPQGAWITCPREVKPAGASPNMKQGADQKETDDGKEGAGTEGVVLTAGWVLWDKESEEDSVVVRLTASIAAHDVAVLTRQSWLRRAGEQRRAGVFATGQREMRAIQRLSLEKFCWRQQPDFGDFLLVCVMYM